MGDGAKVDPAALQAYSDQLEAVSDHGMGTVDKYIRNNLEVSKDVRNAIYCANPYLLIPAAFGGDIFDLQKSTSEMACQNVTHYMADLGDRLKYVCQLYRKNEDDSVNKLWNSTFVDQSSGFHEAPHEKGSVKWDGTDLKLKEIDPEKKAPDAIGLVAGEVGDLAEILDYLTGFDILSWLKKAVPDWGELAALGEQHHEIAKAYEKISEELLDGMHYLGARWDGKAATAFEYYVTKRFLPAIDTIVEMHKTSWHGFRAIAELIDVAITAWVGIFCHWIKDVKIVVRDAKNVFQTVKTANDLWKLAKIGVDLIKDLVDMLKKVWDLACDFRDELYSASDFFQALIKEKFVSGGMDLDS